MNWVLSESTTGKLSYTDLSRILSELIRANAYIIDAQGRVLGVGYTNAEDTSTYTDELGFEKIPEANNRNLLKTLYATGLQTCIYDAFCIIMMPQYDATQLERYQSRFYAHGVFGLLGEWVARDFRETPDEMVDLFYRVMDDRSTL